MYTCLCILNFDLFLSEFYFFNNKVKCFMFGKTKLKNVCIEIKTKKKKLLTDKNGYYLRIFYVSSRAYATIFLLCRCTSVQVCM